jgi:hypothetical protein
MAVFGSAERLASRCALKATFDALAIRNGHKKSVVPLAHKMLRKPGFIAESAAG